MIQPGTLLQGRYKVITRLGKGGMGEVHLAREARLERLVAVKSLLLTEEDEGQWQLASNRFKKEAHILASLDHPGLARVIDFFEEGRALYLVMNFIVGQDLSEVQETYNTVPPVSQVLHIADQLCDVLGYMHSLTPPVIFRDLKPGNIMLDLQGRVRLIDFGIAREVGANSQTTTAFKGAGTPGFSPPEQFGSGTTDARSDIYALGSTMFCLLTLRLPPLAVDLLTGDDTLKPPSAFNPAVPPALDAAILQMMSVRKDDRFHNMTAVRTALRGISVTDAPGVALYKAVRPICEFCASRIKPHATECPECHRSLRDGVLEERPTAGLSGVVVSDTGALGEDRTVIPPPPQSTRTPPTPPHPTVQAIEHVSEDTRRRKAAPSRLWVATVPAILLLALGLGRNWGPSQPNPSPTVTTSPIVGVPPPPPPPPVSPASPEVVLTPVVTTLPVDVEPEIEVVEAHFRYIAQHEWDQAARLRLGNPHEVARYYADIYKTMRRIRVAELRVARRLPAGSVVEGVVIATDETPRGLRTADFPIQVHLKRIGPRWMIRKFETGAMTNVRFDNP